MKAERTKYKRTTPKTTVEYSKVNIELNASLIDLVVDIIKRIFGLHYMYMTNRIHIEPYDHKRTN